MAKGQAGGEDCPGELSRPLWEQELASSALSRRKVHLKSLANVTVKFTGGLGGAEAQVAVTAEAWVCEDRTI